MLNQKSILNSENQKQESCIANLTKQVKKAS